MNFNELYRDVILDHHKHPRGNAPLASSNADSSGLNPTCGDDVTVRFLIEDESVRDVQVTGHGCAISTAASSMFAEKAKGLRIDELKILTERVRTLLKTGEVPPDLEFGDLEALAGVSRFPIRVKCAMLPIATAEQAIEGFEQRRAKAVTVTTEESP